MPEISGLYENLEGEARESRFYSLWDTLGSFYYDFLSEEVFERLTLALKFISPIAIVLLNYFYELDLGNLHASFFISA